MHFPRTSRKTIVVGNKPKLIRINLQQQRIAWGNATLHRVISFEIQASFRQTTRSSSQNEALTQRGSHGENRSRAPQNISLRSRSFFPLPHGNTIRCCARSCARLVLLSSPLFFFFEFSNARHWRHPFRVDRDFYGRTGATRKRGETGTVRRGAAKREFSIYE